VSFSYFPLTHVDRLPNQKSPAFGVFEGMERASPEDVCGRTFLHPPNRIALTRMTLFQARRTAVSRTLVQWRDETTVLSRLTDGIFWNRPESGVKCFPEC